ncbi:hypothetical protein TNCV_2139531 [Trichonephila clavipes]|uniref:Uncharacterized protein n=1 Tax=Trichonephila clavipes TaxID=2585209 RepID=A0A8X6RUP7_TRICX|nr:hypothetical protein TNCV_2139531 [Trichonephila clavipes]
MLSQPCPARDLNRGLVVRKRDALTTQPLGLLKKIELYEWRRKSLSSLHNVEQIHHPHRVGGSKDEACGGVCEKGGGMTHRLVLEGPISHPRVHLSSYSGDSPPLPLLIEEVVSLPRHMLPSTLKGKRVGDALRYEFLVIHSKCLFRRKKCLMEKRSDEERELCVFVLEEVAVTV